jgi:hypothetical protein
MSKRTAEERFWSKVDKSGNCWNWTAYKNAQGYGRFMFNEKVRMAHRVAFELEHGSIPEGLEIDHMCHNESCVNPGHLRAVTPKQNNEHRRKEGWSASGVRGVNWHKGTSRWHARVRHFGVAYFVGSFTDIEEAKAAAIAKRLELFTHNDGDRTEDAA